MHSFLNGSKGPNIMETDREGGKTLMKIQSAMLLNRIRYCQHDASTGQLTALRIVSSGKEAAVTIQVIDETRHTVVSEHALPVSDYTAPGGPGPYSCMIRSKDMDRVQALLLDSITVQASITPSGQLRISNKKASFTCDQVDGEIFSPQNGY
jgi:hypothetical protein